MKVLKFGGTSVGTVESLKNVKKIVESIPGNAIIVVSALGGLTDKLIATAQKAAKGDSSWREDFEAMKKRHFDIIESLVPDEKKEEVIERVKSQLVGLERNFEGVFLLRDLSEKSLDVIVSFGERISSVIVAAIVKNGKRYFSPDFIKTEKWYGKNVAVLNVSNELIKESFSGLGPEEKAIVPGFISTDIKSGDITNLGRGGSDYTGAIIAAALDAEVLEIWTDVDGFMTADPRVVKEAKVIPHLSFTESMELCTFGAKVVYPPTIFPVFHKNIPIKILNTFHLEAPGTLITETHEPEDLEIKGVTALKGVSLITFHANGPHKLESDFVSRAYKVLGRNAVRVIPVHNPDPSLEVKFAVISTEPEPFVKDLINEFAPEINEGKLDYPQIKKNLCSIAVVGKDMKSKSRLATRIGHSLHRYHINVEAHSAGNSDNLVFYLLDESKSPQALTLIHSLTFPAPGI